MNRSGIKVFLVQAKQWLFPLSGFLALGCLATNSNTILYPGKKKVEIRLICDKAYAGSEARHQAWEKSPVRWLFITNDQVVVYFENDRTRLLPKESDWKLAPGKYHCRN